MSFNDIIKKSVLNQLHSSDISTLNIAITLAVAIALGLFIYFVYRLDTRSGLYNRAFNTTLAILPVITAAIMLAMGSNLTISLGMVGALSIVRFRNAVKDPADLTYLFWSISIGIITGANLYELAIILSLAVAVLGFALDLLPAFHSPCLLVITGETADIENDVIALSKEHSKNVKIRSRNIRKNSVEWILEVRTRDEATLVKSICEIDSVVSVHSLTHDGEVRF